MDEMPVEETSEQSAKPAASRAKWTLRSQLLLGVNLPLAALVAAFLVYDYSKELDQYRENKWISLQEEAKTVLPAVLQVRHHGAVGVQDYIDTVCKRMNDAQSPGHHIAVELGDETFQASAHDRDSPEVLEAMRVAARSPEHRTYFRGTEIIVGRFRRNGATVYVSESLENLRDAVVEDVVRHVVGFTVLAVVAALVVNFVLARVVGRPVNHLVQTVQEIGAGRLGAQVPSSRTAELDDLSREINAMSNSLAAADRTRQTQMAKAREIQQNLLPKGVKIGGLHVAHLFEPADDIGGDYFDMLPLDDGAWLFCVADVTGHGVPAAMTAAILKALLLHASKDLVSPGEMLHFINQSLIAINPSGDFATMFLAKISPASRRMTYASAGHEPAWWLSTETGIRELDSTGLILGVVRDASWDETTIDMHPCDRLLIVTDGISETFDSNGEMFGRQRLEEWFAHSPSSPVEDSVARMDELLSSFRGEARQKDDVTAVVIEVACDNA